MVLFLFFHFHTLLLLILHLLVKHLLFSLNAANLKLQTLCETLVLLWARNGCIPGVAVAVAVVVVVVVVDREGEVTVEVLLVVVLAVVVRLRAASMLSFISSIFILFISPVICIINLTTTVPASCQMKIILVFLSKVRNHLKLNPHTDTHGVSRIISCCINRHCLLVKYAGSEAPRNSLDIHDGTNYMEAATLSSANLKKEGTLHVEVRKEFVRPVNLLCFAFVLLMIHFHHH